MAASIDAGTPRGLADGHRLGVLRESAFRDRFETRASRDDVRHFYETVGRVHVGGTGGRSGRECVDLDVASIAESQLAEQASKLVRTRRVRKDLQRA